MRKLIIDGQLFHTPAWHRGMGKYSYELISALLKENAENKKWTSIEVVISSEYERDEDMLKSLSKLKGLKVVELPLQKNRAFDPLAVLDENRRVIDRYIKTDSVEPSNVDYLILSLMQSEISPAFPSLPGIRKALLYYDLIPLMFHETYLSSTVTQKEYLSKISELNRADVYFGISKTVANDIGLYLGVDPRRVTSIDGGGVRHSDTSKPYDIPKPFILMPTGNDLRKNNRRGIEAFEKFNARHLHAYNLVITSSFKQEEQAELQRLSTDVIFTGNISGPELNYLYEKAVGLLFPSEYEGLGMPILEAMGKNKPIACSDIAVFREISKTAMCYFDPLSVSDMSEALDKVIAFKPDLKEYKSILKKYNWKRTAQLLMTTIEQVGSSSPVIQESLLVVGPSPGSSSMIGKVIQYAHSELSRHFTDLTYSFDVIGDSLTQRVNVLNYVKEPMNTLSSMVNSGKPTIYHIDGSPNSAHVLMAALVNPGIAFLHDYNFSNLWTQLQKEGLIDESRVRLERRLSQLAKSESMLVSVITSQRLIVISDKRIYDAVSTVRASLPQDVAEIKLMPSPINAFAYQDIVPAKSIRVEGQELLGLSDMVYEDRLSRATSIDLQAMSMADSEVVTVEASKYQIPSEIELGEIVPYGDYANRIANLIADVYGKES